MFLGIIKGEAWFEERPLLCSIVGVMCVETCLCSLLSIMLISIDRYVHICKYQVSIRYKQCTIFCFLYKILLPDTCPVFGPFAPLLWISADVHAGFKDQIGLPYSQWRGRYHVYSYRFTSGVTPVDVKFKYLVCLCKV